MITKEEIIKMVSKVVRHSQGIKERKLLNPEREWGIGIIVFTVLLLGGFWYNATLFSYYHNIEDRLVGETVSVPNYNYGTLAKVLDRYDERARQFDEIKSGLELERSAILFTSPSATGTASSTISIIELDFATTTDSSEASNNGISSISDIEN